MFVLRLRTCRTLSVTERLVAPLGGWENVVPGDVIVQMVLLNEPR